MKSWGLLFRDALLVVFLLLVASWPAPASAEAYRISVTRVQSNFYEVTGSDLLIQTKYCYEYASYADAVLVWEGKYSSKNKLVFLDFDGDAKETCDVKRVLQEIEPR